MQIIPIKNLNIKKVVLQFLPFFRLKCWFKGQTISRIHLMHTNWCVLIEISMEIGMLNFWLELLVTAQTEENYFSIKIERLLFLKFLKILAFFDSYFWPFNKSEEKIKVIFVISVIMPSIWNVFIKFRWHDEKLTDGWNGGVF